MKLIGNSLHCKSSWYASSGISYDAQSRWEIGHGLSPEQPLPPLPGSPFILKHVFLGGPWIEIPDHIKEMFEEADKRNIKAWIETRPMKYANKTILDMKKRHYEVSLLSRQRENI